MIRILGGDSRGRRLAVPKGHGIRPSSVRVREAVFDRLQNGGLDPPLAGARFLDVFAGTGAVGLEALSRGASLARFIERDREALAVLRRNVGTAGQILARDAAAPGAAPGGHDIAYLDPPFGSVLWMPAVAALAAGGWLVPGALVVLETSHREEVEVPGLIDRRRYGGSAVAFVRHGAVEWESGNGGGADPMGVGNNGDGPTVPSVRGMA